MTHTNGATRHTTPPATQLTLIEATAGWQDTSTRAQTLRETALERSRTKRLKQLREQIEAETQLLQAIQKAQQTILTEIDALAKQKPMAIDELKDELHHLLNTDDPHNIAKRLGYTDIENLIYRLNRNGLKNLAKQLKKPLKKPPAPYPSHQWRTRKPTK